MHTDHRLYVDTLLTGYHGKPPPNDTLALKKLHDNAQYKVDLKVPYIYQLFSITVLKVHLQFYLVGHKISSGPYKPQT